jgi:hypothetical protein
MKLFKFIIILLISVSITNCSDDSGDAPYILSNDNIAGVYNISKFNISTKVSAVTSGIPVTISNASSVGDTFQFNFTLNANGNYTASGKYRIVSIITPIGSAPINNDSLLNVNDSGTYKINPTNNTITFTSSTGDFLEGTLEVVTFNETTISLTQEVEEVEGPIITDIKANINFIRQ